MTLKHNNNSDMLSVIMLNVTIPNVMVPYILAMFMSLSKKRCFLTSKTMTQHITNLSKSSFKPTRCQCYKTFFPLSLMTRANKLEGLSLETLSSQVLEFEGKARANQIGASFKCFLLE